MLKIVLFFVLFLVSMGIIWVLLIKPKDYVRVAATGKAQVKPNEATVDVGLRISDVAEDKLNVEREKSAATFQNIISNIQQQAPKVKLETPFFQVSENYQVTTQEKVRDPKTFTISNRITVTLKDEIELLPSLVDSAIANGANDVGNIRYSLTDEAIEKSVKLAQVDSMKNAYERAKNLAESGGKTLGSIVSIEETGQNEVYPLFAKSSAAPSSSTPILAPETMPINSSVTVQYNLI